MAEKRGGEKNLKNYALKPMLLTCERNVEKGKGGGSCKRTENRKRGYLGLKFQRKSAFLQLGAGEKSLMRKKDGEGRIRGAPMSRGGVWKRMARFPGSIKIVNVGVAD